MYENKVIIIGNLTRKPELKSLDNGTKLTSLSVAVNSTWIDRDGNKQESVEYIGVAVFGKTAENCAQYLDKGQKVYVEGKIKNRVEETEEGKRYHTGIVAERVQFGQKSAGMGESTTSGVKAPESGQNAKITGGTEPIEYPNEKIDLSNIPF